MIYGRILPAGVSAPTALEDGDVIGLGPVTLVFEILGTTDTTESDLDS
jgi:hypothetical protein